MHGGKSLTGASSPTFATGRYSKHLPTRLASRYEVSQSDPDLLALKHEIALLDARLSELLDRLDTGESQQAWSMVASLCSELRKAVQDEDMELADRVSKRLLHLADKKRADADIWDQVAVLVEQRRKLVESEGKRLQAMQQLITAEEAMTLLGVVVQVVRRHVSDRPTLGAISADLARLVAVGARDPA